MPNYTDRRKPIFDVVRAASSDNDIFNKPGKIAVLDLALDKLDVPRAVFTPKPKPKPVASTGHTKITPRIALELLSHESIVREAYRDSKGIWTWGVGVTSRSGHSVERYKDKQTTIKQALEVYIWLLQENYLPGVLKAFEGFRLTEAELGAALSFNYNTGDIRNAKWVKSVQQGDVADARLQIMNYQRPPELKKRRQKERALFFDGKWSNDGLVTVYPVRKPSYKPNWSKGRRVNVNAQLKALLEG